MQILSFEVENFRSVRKECLDFDEINVLIGKNNVGKSNIVKSLYSFRDIATNRVDCEELYDRAVTRDVRGEKLSFSCEIELSDTEQENIIQQTISSAQLSSEDVSSLRENEFFSSLEYEIQIDGNGLFRCIIKTEHSGGKFILASALKEDDRHRIQTLKLDELPDITKNEIVAAPTNPKDPLPAGIQSEVLAIFEDWHTIAPFRKPDEEGEFRAQSELKPSGSNLTTVLQGIQGDGTSRFSNICDMFKNIMQNVENIRIPTEENSSNEPVPVIRIDEKHSSNIELDELSSGSKEILLLVTELIMSKSDMPLVFLEEPELHLHPDAERRILQELKSIVEKNGPQIIITTHSDVFVDNVSVEDIFLIKRDDYTSIETVSDAGYALAEAGHSKSHYLQADRVVFVEGRSDKVILENWADTIGCSFERNGVVVRVYGGDDIFEDQNPYAEAIPDMLGQMAIPYKYIFDSDGEDPGGKKSEIAGKISESGAKIHVWNRHSIESYLAESPRAVAEPVGASIEQVQQEYPLEPSNIKMKSRFDNIYTDVANVGYNEEHHGAVISANMQENEIPDEVKSLIREIVTMEGRQ